MGAGRPALLAIDLYVPGGTSWVLCLGTVKVFPVVGLRQRVWFLPSRSMKQPDSLNILSNSLYFIFPSPPIDLAGDQSILRIITYVNARFYTLRAGSIGPRPRELLVGKSRSIRACPSPQAPYRSPCRRRQGSLIPPLSSNRKRCFRFEKDVSPESSGYSRLCGCPPCRRIRTRKDALSG